MNLTTVSRLFKKGLVILGIFAGVYYLLIFVLFPASKSAINLLFVKKEPATPVYGMLDPLEFTEKPVEGLISKYELNTGTGKLPTNIPDKITVYKYKPYPFSYLAGENAIADAKYLGFEEKDLITDLKGTTYKWRDLETGSILEIKIESKELELNSNIANKLDEYPKGTLNDNTAVQYTVDLFKKLNRIDTTLYTSENAKVTYGALSENKIIKANSFREANVTKVDLYRKINELTILGPDPKKGMLSVILRKPSRENTPLNYPIIKAIHWDIEKTSKATYQIISVQEAWNEVQKGNGIITSVVPSGANPFDTYTSVKVEDVLINNIYLAYYDDYKLQRFLQPIYVFEGNYRTRGTSGGEITIYFPAISGEYIKAQTSD